MFWFWVFWVSLAVTVVTYLGYPVILAIAERLLYRPVRKKDILPTVSILVVAYNEEDTIAGKLKNLLELDYPADKLEIVVASDGSNDETVSIAKQFVSERVSLYHYTLRRGKPSVLNETVPKLTGEIIVLCDARQLFAKDCIRNLVKNFADSSVGGVSGELVFEKSGQDGLGQGLDAYWRYEKSLRRREAAIHSSVGGTGAILSLRRELWQPIQVDTILDDVVIPFGVVRQKRRFVFDSQAKIYDRAAATGENEFARKVRTLAGNYQIVFNPSTMNTPLFTKIGVQFILHKVLRLLMPATLLGMFFGNLYLTDMPRAFQGAEQSFYTVFFFGQFLFYFSGLFGYAFEKAEIKIPFLHFPYAFSLLHLSMIFGFFQWASGRIDVAWHKAGSTTVIKDVGPWALWQMLGKLFMDVGLIHVGVLLGFCIYFRNFDFLFMPNEVFASYWNAEIPVWITLSSFMVFYLSRVNERPLREMEPEHLLNVLFALVVNTIFIILMLFLRREVAQQFSLSVVAYSFVINSIMLCTWRIIARGILMGWFTKKGEVKRVILVSKYPGIPSIIERIENTGFPPRKVVGVVCTADMGEGLPVVGAPSELELVLIKHPCDELFIHSFDLSTNEVLEMIGLCDRFGIDKKIVPSYYDIVSSRSRVSLVNFIPMLEIAETPIQNWQRLIKRSTDIAVSFFLLLLFGLPLLVFTLINQSRLRHGHFIGRGDQVFTVYHFEKSDAGHEAVIFNLLLLMINVFFGSMSLVGPRILGLDEARHLKEWEKSFLQLRPGVTGLYQVMQKREPGMESEAVSNIFYQRNYSYLSDLKIIARAVIKLVSQKQLSAG